MLPITTSSNKDRAAGYIAAGDIDLTDDEVERIDRAGQKGAEGESRRKTVWSMIQGAALIGLSLLAWSYYRL